MMVRENKLGLTELTEAEERPMIQLGIERRPIDSFRIGPFRYSNLKDAVAQAKRQTPNQPGGAP